jgi:hypothetical protein
VKRRRIREIVAAALTDYTGEPTRPDEITVSVRCAEDAPKRVEVGVLWGLIQAATKREALRLSLAVHGWDRWKVAPSLGDALTSRANCPHLWPPGSMALWLGGEPVPLPEEAPRG